MLIAIDGPAASGKGTLGRRLAAHFGLAYLDTGTLYRAVGRALLDAGVPLSDADAARDVALGLDLSAYSDDELRGGKTGEAASIVSAIPAVRAALLQRQRDFAARPGGAVLDGRDIGTVVCPDADAKIFVTASPEERARRRHADLTKRGERTSFEEVLADIRRRDERDSGRSAAPLRASEDAVVLDTTSLDAEASFAAVLEIVRQQAFSPA